MNTCFFYKQMKIRNQARLCLAISDFQPQIMLKIITVNSDHECQYYFNEINYNVICKTIISILTIKLNHN